MRQQMYRLILIEHNYTADTEKENFSHKYLSLTRQKSAEY